MEIETTLLRNTSGIIFPFFVVRNIFPIYALVYERTKNKNEIIAMIIGKEDVPIVVLYKNPSKMFFCELMATMYFMREYAYDVYDMVNNIDGSISKLAKTFSELVEKGYISIKEGV